MVYSYRTYTTKNFQDLFDSIGSRITNFKHVENKGDHQIFIVAPGLRKKDFPVQLENDNILSISYERDGENLKHLFSEGKYSKSWELPFTPEEDGLTAIYKDGILTVTINKPAEQIPASYQVKVN